MCQALEATGEINGKLIWSNTGYLINWYLTEMKQLLGEATVESLRHALFFEKTLTTGEDNPLWRTVVLRDGLAGAPHLLPALSLTGCAAMWRLYAEMKTLPGK